MEQSISGYQLSINQKAFWQQSSQLSEQSHLWSVRIIGLLQQEPLQASLVTMVNQHESLRTQIAKMSGMEMPVQVVEEQMPVEWVWEDIAPSDLEETLANLASTNNNWSFRVYRLEEKEYILTITAPALLSDTWSLSHLVDELLSHYSGQISDEDKLQYLQYSEWQNNLLEEDAEQGLDYWLSFESKLQDIPTLPLRKKSTSSESQSWQQITVPINQSLQTTLIQHAESKDHSLKNMVFTSWYALVARHAEQDSLTIGYVSDGRAYEEFHQIQGLFSKTLPLPIQIGQQDTLSTLLMEVEDALENAESYREYFSWGLYTDDNIKFLPITFEALDLGAKTNYDKITAQPVYVQQATAATEIKLSFIQHSEGFNLKIGFDTQAYDAATIEALGNQLVTLISHWNGQDQVPYSSLNLVSPDTLGQLKTWSQGANLALPAQDVVNWIDEQATHNPLAIAIQYQERSYNYTQLKGLTNGVAQLLTEQYEVQSGDKVALLAGRSDWLIISLLGVLKSGATYVPLDPSYPEKRSRFILEDVGPQCVITDVPEMLGTEVGALKVIDLKQLPELVKPSDSWERLNLFDQESLAYILYTSGTTGRPKGCKVSRQNLKHYVYWANQQYFSTTLEGHFGLYTSLGFDLTITSIFTTLSRGKTLHIYEEGLGVEELLKQMFSSESIVDAVKITPSHIRILPELGIDTTNIKLAIVGGEAVESTHVQLLTDLNTEMAIYNEYGPTETTVGCVVKQVSVSDERILIGKPVANTEALVVDAQGRPVPEGIMGELWIGGLGVTQGYLNDEERTSEKFVSHPVVPEQEVYRTGDYVRWTAAGFLEYLGRKDEQVKIRGFRIELGEIIETLRQNPSVEDALVLAWGTEEKELAGYLIGAEADIDKVRSWLSEQLPDYMLPAYWVNLLEFPLTVNGKIDTKALASPEDIRKSQTATYEPPRNEAEEALAAIWAQVLGREQVGIQNNFFHLGGDSIKAIQVVSRLREAGYRLEVRDVLQYPLISELSTMMEQTIHRITSEPVIGLVPLGAIQEKFFAEHPQGLAHYNQSFILTSDERLKEEHLEQVYQSLVQHHDMLRVKYTPVIKGWEQEVQAFIPDGGFSFHDFSDESALTTKQTQELQSNMSLEHGPLFKVALFRLKDEDRLLFICHHLIVDGFSWRVLLEDFKTAYDQALAGIEIQLPAKTDSFKDWVIAANTFAQSDTILQEIPYWEQIIKEERPPLPVDQSNGSNQFGDIKTINHKLGVDLTSRLLTDVHEAYNTEITDLLMAALAQTLKRWSGHDKALIYLEGHGRESVGQDLDLGRTVGWFTAKYPVLLTASTDDLNILIRSTKEQLREIPNKGIGYGLLRYLSNVESLIPATVPSISFNYLGQIGLPDDTQSFKADNSQMDTDAIDPKLVMQQELSFTGVVMDQQLQIAVSYSQYRFHSETMEQLVASFMEHLTQLVQHCLKQEETTLSPSDLDYQDFDMDELDDFLENLEKS